MSIERFSCFSFSSISKGQSCFKTSLLSIITITGCTKKENKEIAAKKKAASLINESLDEIAQGAKGKDGFAFLEEQKKKYK